jgi:hypothetical protein
MTYIYRGDHRLRIRRIIWHWHGRVRHWEVSFDRGPRVSVGMHRRFTVALLQALRGIYVPQRDPR